MSDNSVTTETPFYKIEIYVAEFNEPEGLRDIKYAIEDALAYKNVTFGKVEMKDAGENEGNPLHKQGTNVAAFFDSIPTL